MNIKQAKDIYKETHEKVKVGNKISNKQMIMEEPF